MTIYLPLSDHAPTPQVPAFLSRVTEPATYIADVAKAIAKAKRIAVVCGAGISVQAGIPDFRSSNGLFQSMKRENPKESLSSGKDLFDAAVFNSEPKTNLFCQMISRLAVLSENASPTPFHQLLRSLDERGKLLRVYTQNIDALEAKAGLSFGVPDHSRGKGKGKLVKPDKLTEELSPEQNSVPQPSTSKLPSPPPALPEERTSEIPRCIPLHGTLRTMHCLACTHTYPLTDHLSSLSKGVLPDCPECTALETTRSLVGKRPRGVGKLRPSVVLYNEDHRNGEGVGSVVGRDLVANSKRSGPDLLLVVGTSLRVPGTKRIVREFSKAIRSRGSAKPAGTSKLPTPAPTPVPSPSSTPRRSPFSEIDVQDACDGQSMRTIYLNLDFPVPTREWDNVFDVWLQGDAQQFSEVVTTELDKQDRAKEAAVAKRRKNAERNSEEIITPPASEKTARFRLQVVPTSKIKKGRKRLLSEDTTPTKKPRVTLIVKDPIAPTSAERQKSQSSRNPIASPKNGSKSNKQNLPKPLSKSSAPLREAASTQRRSSSHKAKSKCSTDASPTVSTFQFQSYRIPEVLITVPRKEQLYDYGPRSPKFNYYTPGSSDTKKSGKDKGFGQISPLDLLADAATVVPRADPLQLSPSPNHIYSYRNYTPSDAQFTQDHSSFSFPHHPSRCSYARSYTCECQVACPLSPTPSSSSYTDSPPSVAMAGVPTMDNSSVPAMSLSTPRYEVHVPGPPTPASSLPAAPTHLKPDISNLLNGSDPPFTRDSHRGTEGSPSPSSPSSPTTPRAPKRKRVRVLYSTPSQRAKIRKATAARHSSTDPGRKPHSILGGTLRQSEGQTLADKVAKIELDSDTDVDVETNIYSSQFTLALH